MSEIPYIFETPVPVDFRKNGWFKCDNTLKFVTWAFSRCSTRERIVCHDGRNITLKPYQFIFGRLICSFETNMSEDEVRTQVKRMENAGFLRKIPNKFANRFTLYEWVTSSFSQTKNKTPSEYPSKSPTENLSTNTSEQSFIKQTPNKNPNKNTKSPPTNPHNLEEENVDLETNTTPNPLKEKEVGGGNDEYLKKRSIDFVKFCKEKNIPIQDRLLNEMYRLSPQGAINAAETLYKRIKKNDKLPNNIGGWYRTEVIKEDEFVKMKRDYE